MTCLTINRPQKANALSASLVEALLNAVEYACTDGTRLMVIDAAGAHFCSGFDFTDYHASSEGDLALRLLRILYRGKPLSEPLIIVHDRRRSA